MKLKKKTCGILAVLLLLMTVFTGMQEVMPVHAEGLKVSINGTELEDGRYYEFGGSRGSGTMSECDPAALPEAYIYYSAGIMEVKGIVRIYSNGGSSTEILKIENGTLTLKGDGNFYLTNYNDTETLVTGTADAVLKADEYTGDIQVSGRGGNALIKGLSLVDLKTAGEITLDADDVTGDAFISAGSVKLEADLLDIYLSGGAVKYLIEATDEQNGEISLKKNDSLNSFDLVNGNNINVTEAFFKATDTFLSSNGNSNSNSSSGRIVLVGETIAEGNLELETVKDVTIRAKKTAVKGNLAVNAENGYGVEITSEGGAVSTGSTEITAPSLVVMLQANGDAAIIEGNAKINANRISMKSANNAAIAGDADLQARNYITLLGAEGHSVIGGSNILMNAAGGELSISRTGSAATGTPPLLGGTLQTQNDIVKYSDGGENWVQIMATGETYDADNCEHPILAGYSGRCMVCGASDIEYAELIGTDGTTKRMLNGDFGGTGAHNDFRYLEDGDTIKFVKDIYGNGRTAAIGDSKAVTLDLNGHTLILDTISSGNNLTIANGNYKGKITNGGVGLTKELTFKNAKAALTDLQWMTNSGVKLEGSEVTVSGNDGSGQCWLEKLTMDEDSKLVLKNVSQGISNYANVALEESLGTIRGFLPKDYSIANRKRNPADVDYRNTIVDADGQIAQNVELRYRKMTDADLSATLNPTTYTYDGTAKEPEVLVVYDGQTLTKDTDYTVAYSDNKNAGNAEVTITGIGVYHEAAHLQFTIGKAGQAAPTGLKAVNTSKTGASDGAIENLTTAMEYSTDEIHWTKVTDGTKISQLAAGDYFVRYAETGNYLASASTKVTVAVKEAPSTGNGSNPGETTGSNGTTGSTGTNGSGTVAGTSNRSSSDAAGSNTAALTGTTQKTATIKTGDETPVGRILLLMFSAAGLLVVAAAGRKKYC